MITATHRQAIVADVIREVCPMTAEHNDRAGRRRHAADVAATQSHCNRFMAVMDSGSPFQSEDEAIQSLAPIAVWIFGWAARQLAILVIQAIWRRWFAAQ